MRRLMGQPVENSNENSGFKSSGGTQEIHPERTAEGAGNCPTASRRRAATYGQRLLERWKLRILERFHLKELLITVSAYWAAYLIYLFAGQVFYSDFDGTAMSNARRVIEFERSIGIFWEPSLQEWAVSLAPPLVTEKGMTVLINWVYILAFAPLIGAISVAIYFTNRTAYRHYRKIFLLSYGIAIIVFLAFPLAPPRMFPDQFVDTIAVFGPHGYGTREMGRFYNAYAAMPSLHFGWSVVFGVFFLRLPNKLAKVSGVAYPAVMLLAIIVTANHYIIDAIAGGLLVLGSFILVESHLWQRLQGLVNFRARSETACLPVCLVKTRKVGRLAHENNRSVKAVSWILRTRRCCTKSNPIRKYCFRSCRE